jgi:hypothetical protein
MTMPSLDYEIVTSTGERGWVATWFAHESDESMVRLKEPFKEEVTTETRVFVSIDSPKGITRRWTMRLEGYLKERERDCEFEFGLMVAGRAKVRFFCSLIFLLVPDLPVYVVCSSSSMMNSSSIIGLSKRGESPSSPLDLWRRRGSLRLKQVLSTSLWLSGVM